MNQPNSANAPAAVKTVLLVCVVMLFIAPSHVLSQGTATARRITHAGYNRLYLLYVPSSYTLSNQLPVVVNLHGAGASASLQMRWSGMNAVAETNGFLVAYPEAVGGLWLGPNEDDPYDDIGFIDSILSDVSSAYAVNASRIYATGLSAGAGMAYGLGILRSDVFAAIAPVAGVRYYERGTTNLFPAYVPPFPSRPLPLLHIQGTKDQVLPYEGGYSSRTGKSYPSAGQWLAGFVAYNGCDATPITLALADIDKTDGSTVQLIRYQNGQTYLDSQGQARQAEILFFRIEGGGHSWPAGFVTSYPSHCLPVNHDFDASTVIWEFFSRHELPMKGGRFDQIAYSPQTGFQCIFRDAALGQTFLIETCDSILDNRWSELTNFVFSTTTVITDRSAGGSRRYYRSVHVRTGP